MFKYNIFTVFLVLINISESKAFDHTEIKIKSAYIEAETGRLLIRFEEKSMANNRHQLFYGNEDEIFQLENVDSTKVQTNGSEGFKLTFSDSRLKDNEGHFFEAIDPNDPNMHKITNTYTVYCPDHTHQSAFTRLTQNQIDKLQAKIRAGVIFTKPLPAVRELLALFKKRDGTIIYLDGYKYKLAHESYRLFVGKPGKMKQIEDIIVIRQNGGITVKKSGIMSTLLLIPSKDNFISPRWKGEAGIKPVDSTFDLSTLKIDDRIYRANTPTPCDKFFENQTHSGERTIDSPAKKNQ